MRTLQLTHTEIEIIADALLFTYLQQLKTANDADIILIPKEAKDKILRQAEMFGNLHKDINDSKKDIKRGK